jgi:hypothetical protein
MDMSKKQIALKRNTNYLTGFKKAILFSRRA